MVVQVTATEVTLAPEALPVPAATRQSWFGPLGWVETVTAYAPVPAIEVGNVKLVALAATTRLSPPLFCRTRPVPASPETVPPTVTLAAAVVVQETATLVTLALAVPLPLETVQV